MAHNKEEQNEGITGIIDRRVMELDRRRDSGIVEREFVENRLAELDRRRDQGLSSKLEAIEKYFNLSIATRAEALSIAIDRIQGDNRSCAARCALQVKAFYDIINPLKERCGKRLIVVNLLRDTVEKQGAEIDALKEKIATLENWKNDLENNKIKEKVIALDQWKNNFLIKNVTVAVVSSVAIVQLGFQGFTWLIDFLSKVKIGPGGP